jgi:hypothetical protein
MDYRMHGVTVSLMALDGCTILVEHFVGDIVAGRVVALNNLTYPARICLLHIICSSVNFCRYPF